MIFYQADLVKARSVNSLSASKAGKALIAESILRRIRRLELLQEQGAVILKQITKIGETSAPVVALQENIHGCGLLTAGAIKAELVTIRRFGGRDKLAKYAGIAPTLKSSGSHHRLYTNPFGNRLLNKALHTIALSQIAVKGDDRGKIYYRKKLKEGKTKLWALRCLKRRLINLVFRVLKQTEAVIGIGSAEKAIS